MNGWIALICFSLSYVTYAGLYDQQFPLGAITSPQDGAHQQHADTLNIAIIGAGAAGASAAYHLSRFNHELDIPINITVFDRNSYIGGRSTTVIPHGEDNLPVELGASIFVKANSILVNATRDLQLPISSLTSPIRRPVLLRSQPTPQHPSLGIWDGVKFRLILGDSRLGSWWDVPKILFKYGFAPVRTLSLMKKTVAQFLRMYEDPVFPFLNLTQAAMDVGLSDVTTMTGNDYLQQNAITGSFGGDVVQASTRVNYAQNLDFIHGLEAMVCMATDGAMAVKGGNWRIFEGMLSAANAHVQLNSAVSQISKQGDGTYVVEYSQSDAEESSSRARTQQFDAVILASPLQFMNITITDVEEAPLAHGLPGPIPYVELHVTLFATFRPLSPSFFNLPPDGIVPLAVLTTLPDTEEPLQGNQSVGSPGFFSISQVEVAGIPGTDDYCEKVFKIFSASPPKPEDLCAFIENPARRLASPCRKESCLRECGINWIHRKLWNSYPYESPRATFDQILLDPDESGTVEGNAGGLWYTGGMDSFISTMETNALMGRNVARLLLQSWHEKRLHKIDLSNGS